MPVKQKTVVVIAGPTAVGKTAVAIQIALHLNTRIISADSRQCYKELNIGVARPSLAELETVKHYFIASHSIHQKVNAVVFEQYASEKVAQIFQHQDTAVMVGGTGLYIKAFCEGLDEIPEVPDEIRNEIKSEYKRSGLTWLQHQVQQVDPHFYREGEIQNPQRLIRALEVYKVTGQSILTFRKREESQRNFRIIKIALTLPKEHLHEHIHHRVDKMLEEGLLEEVQSLMPYQQLNALQTVGYRELFDYFNGQTSLQDAIALIRQNTRQYAKRQITWFKRDQSFQWFAPNELNTILQFIRERQKINNE